MTSIQDTPRKCLSDGRPQQMDSILIAHNYVAMGLIGDEEPLPVIQEVETAVKSLKMGKSAGVDNIHIHSRKRSYD